MGLLICYSDAFIKIVAFLRLPLSALLLTFYRFRKPQVICATIITLVPVFFVINLKILNILTSYKFPFLELFYELNSSYLKRKY